ncbi:nitric oxide reductase activation protein NorD [Coralliovum pocilloporae]|uniref:nitric oxide reductase activation protein NorD n=1 Tax=Coralliovum pocilloporae TaxID=3066369 RepID=UPI00330742AE
MGEFHIKPWEPEESVGHLWHGYASRLDQTPHFPDAAVALDDMTTRLGILFRGLGGDASVELAPAPRETARHRLSWLRRLGHAADHVEMASFDGSTLRLPETLDCLPKEGLNEDLYKWLAVTAAIMPEIRLTETDPLRRDLETLCWAFRMNWLMEATFPSMKPIADRLKAGLLALRAKRKLPETEQAVESIIRILLDDPAGLSEPAVLFYAEIVAEKPDFSRFSAPRRYRPFRYVPFWLDIREQKFSAPRQRQEADETPVGGDQSNDKKKKAQRRESDQADRNDSLILNRFETILSWTEFMNINRKVEDDDEASAKKVADDHNEMGLAEIKERPATRLSFDLDMAPEDLDRERLSGERLYPEWDCHSGSLLKDYCRILVNRSESEDAPDLQPLSADMRKQIRHVRQRFEALRPRRTILPRQLDGDDLDMDAAIRSWVDIKATGEASDRVFRQIRNASRDLSVATLFDTSRSTESLVEEQPVIEIARNAVTAFAYGLDHTGDDHAIYSFSSLKRDRVFVDVCKEFGETMNSRVVSRLAALKPGFYTRMGAAIRFASDELQKRGASKRLLLVITDGKPNDLDHYEGRYGVEDTRKAVTEARMMGHTVFAVTIDAKARTYLPRIFGRDGYAIVAKPEKLADSLPMIFRHLVT